VRRVPIAISAALLVFWGFEPVPGPTAAGGEPRFGFATPRSGTPAVGTNRAELVLELPEGVAAAEVRLLVDGRPAGTLVRPPWVFLWEAGDGSRPHKLEAQARLSDGRLLRATVETAPLRIDEVVNVDLVELYVVVRDRQGNYVQGLAEDDFRVFDNGRPQRIERFSAERRPMRLAIVLDNSRSMKGIPIEAAREAALALLDSLAEGDEGLVLTFSDTVRVLEGPTSDRRRLARAIGGVQVEGGTALYDALWRAAETVESFDGRKAVVLLSDGRDEAANGIEPGSLHTYEEALDRALRSGAVVFTVGVGRDLDRQLDLFGRRSLASILRELADITGGRAFLSVSARKIRTSFRDIAEEIRNQYFLGYVPPDLAPDGRWHEVRVTTARPDLLVTARKGYYAPRRRTD
jgi:Ca-activated chloride channel family protein